MRSKIFQEILDETPAEVEARVLQYAEHLLKTAQSEANCHEPAGETDSEAKETTDE